MSPAGEAELGTIIILNGAPRSGKSSIQRAIQQLADRPFMALGVDGQNAHVLPERLRPGIGLRPGGERPDLEGDVRLLFTALVRSISAYSRLGLCVVVDLGLHDAYSRPLRLAGIVTKELAGLPVLLVGIDCPLPVILARRAASDREVPGLYDTQAEQGPVPPAVLRWQEWVHRPGIYDLRLDSSTLSPEDAAAVILAHASAGPPQPSALERLSMVFDSR